MTFIECSAENCLRPARIVGMCPTHYNRKISGANAQERDFSEMPECSVSFCTIPANSRQPGSYCDPHYQIKYRGVDPETRVIKRLPEDRKISDRKCRIDGCPQTSNTKGCCKSHYKRIVQGKLPVPEGSGIKVNPPCSFPGCVNLQESLKSELCHSHNCQVQEGRPLAPLRGRGDYVSGALKCCIDGCRRLAISRRMCQSHLSRANKYALTAFELEQMLAVDRCENPGCTNSGKLHIDHDHESGKVRGMLCAGCNTSLGMLKEDVDRILGLAEYKRLHS